MNIVTSISDTPIDESVMFTHKRVTLRRGPFFEVVVVGPPAVSQGQSTTSASWISSAFPSTAGGLGRSRVILMSPECSCFTRGL